MQYRMMSMRTVNTAMAVPETTDPNETELNGQIYSSGYE